MKLGCTLMINLPILLEIGHLHDQLILIRQAFRQLIRFTMNDQVVIFTIQGSLGVTLCVLADRTRTAWFNIGHLSDQPILISQTQYLVDQTYNE